MPIKPKQKSDSPKSKKEIDEALSLFETALKDLRPAHCSLCATSAGLYRVAIDALRWSRGRRSRLFTGLIYGLRKAIAARDKQHKAHAE